MVDKAGGYHSPSFKMYCGVMQSDPLSPVIFYIAIYAVMHHWVTMVVSDEAVPEVLGRSI